jgi:hypothetical protein
VSAVRAVLRDVDGRHLTNLEEHEVASYNYMADRGQVHRFQVMKKGRMTLIFRLKEKVSPELIPSLAESTSCGLTMHDSEGLAGLNGFATRTQRERWAGWGLIPARAC